MELENDGFQVQNLLFQGSMFRFHVSFRGSTYSPISAGVRCCPLKAVSGLMTPSHVRFWTLGSKLSEFNRIHPSKLTVGFPPLSRLE